MEDQDDSQNLFVPKNSPPMNKQPSRLQELRGEGAKVARAYVDELKKQGKSKANQGSEYLRGKTAQYEKLIVTSLGVALVVSLLVLTIGSIILGSLNSSAFSSVKNESAFRTAHTSAATLVGLSSVSLILSIAGLAFYFSAVKKNPFDKD